MSSRQTFALCRKLTHTATLRRCRSSSHKILASKSFAGALCIIPIYSIVFCLRFKAVGFALSFPFITSAKLFLSRPVRTGSDFLPCSGIIEKARPLFTVELCFHALYERVLLRRLLIFTFLQAFPFRRKGKR